MSSPVVKKTRCDKEREKEMIGEHVVRNGIVIKSTEAVVPVSMREVQYSFYTYESLRVLKGNIVHLEDHLERLFSSCRGIHLAHPFTKEEIGGWVRKLIVADGIGDSTMKIIVYGGPSPLCFVLASAMLSYPDSYYRNGVGAITYRGERLLPNCKTGNLLLNYMAVEEAKRQGCFEALLVDREGRALEGTRSNFYGFHDGKLYTARDEEVLLGVTRSRVLEAAKEMGIEVVYQAPKENDLHEGFYDEIFISATSMAAMPLGILDGKPFSGPYLRTNRICQLVRSWELDDTK